MTEREKREAHLYDANREDLLKAREEAKEKCHAFNLLHPSDREGQRRAMEDLLGSVKGSFHIVAPFWCDYGSHIHIGEAFFANHNTVILDGAEVRFGDHVFIAPNCGFYTAGHPMDPAARRQGLEYALPIEVGDDVWFGAGVQVMPGVHIGSNVVIGAGSLVLKDIPDNSVAVGNPCRVIRRLPPSASC